MSDSSRKVNSVPAFLNLNSSVPFSLSLQILNLSFLFVRVNDDIEFEFCVGTFDFFT